MILIDQLKLHLYVGRRVKSCGTFWQVKRCKLARLSVTLKDPQDGACLPLKDIPLGSQIHSIECNPGRGGQLVRSAGTCATLVGKDLDGVRGSVRLPPVPSKTVLACRAVIGRSATSTGRIESSGKREELEIWGGDRPFVHVAMNAVDHPHGGGKGGRSKGKPSQSIWGWVCK